MRGPHDATDVSSMTMKFYYKTLPGFFFPSRPLENQPPVGTITPYLRVILPDGQFEGPTLPATRMATGLVMAIHCRSPIVQVGR